MGGGAREREPGEDPQAGREGRRGVRKWGGPSRREKSMT